MKASELRIGNYLQREATSAVVMVDFSHIAYIANHPEQPEYSALPLTSEWLEKFGFGESDNGDPYGGYLKILPNYAQIRIRTAKQGFTWYSGLGEVDLLHVHQLQNLYFALTGEELTLKETSTIDGRPGPLKEPAGDNIKP